MQKKEAALDAQVHRFGFQRLPGDVGPMDLIAAVGTNSGTESDHAYVFGFGLAAEQLFDALKRTSIRRGTDAVVPAVYIDALIYPLGFCMRHYLELALKAGTRDCRALRGKSTKPDFWHSLREIWPSFVEACNEDRRLGSFAGRLAPLVEAIDEVDPSGQAFRYRADLHGVVHMGNTAVIPVRKAEKTFRELRGVLDEFFDKLEELGWEYSFQTYTRKLSRADLIVIADAIKTSYRPDDKSWMKQLRGRIKQRYDLTNSEFDEADALISATSFLSWRAGIERPLSEISTQTIALLYFALAAFPEENLLSDAEWAGLRGIVEVMRPVGAPEDYPRVTSWHLEHLDRFDRADTARSVMRRPDFFLSALQRMGQPTLVATWRDHWGWGQDE